MTFRTAEWENQPSENFSAHAHKPLRFDYVSVFIILPGDQHQQRKPLQVSLWLVSAPSVLVWGSHESRLHSSLWHKVASHGMAQADDVIRTGIKRSSWFHRLPGGWATAAALSHMTSLHRQTSEVTWLLLRRGQQSVWGLAASCMCRACERGLLMFWSVFAHTL